MKLETQRLLCACALFLAVSVLHGGTASAQDSGGGEKKKQDPIKRVWSALPSIEPETEAAKSLARTMQSYIGAGLTKQAVQAQRGPMSKKNALGQGARFAVNDATADGSRPVAGRVLTPAGDLFVSYIPTTDGVVGIIEASTRLPTKSKGDKKRRAELNVVGFKLNKVVEFYQFVFWTKRAALSLATLVSGMPDFVSNGVSPAQAAKLLSAPMKNAKVAAGKEPLGVSELLAWKCGTVGPDVATPPQPSGGGSGSACNAPTMADLAGCSAIMCAMPLPGVPPPPGTGCCCADGSGSAGGGSGSNGNGGDTGTGCPDGKPMACAMRFDGGPPCWCEGTGSSGENPPGSGTGGGGQTGGGDLPPVREGDTTSCRPEEMVCVKPAPGVNYTGPDCYCPGQRGGEEPQPGKGDPEPITAPGFVVDPLDPIKKIGNDPWCQPSCGDGQCSGNAWDPADPNDRADGMPSNWSCPESPESCPQDCNSAKQQEESTDPVGLKLASAPFCGNGRCEDVTCSAIGCPEPETKENCEADCGRFLGVDPVGTAAP